MTERRREPRVLLLNPPGTRMYQRDTFCASVGKGRYALPPGDLILLSGAFRDGADVTALDALAEGLDGAAVRARVAAADPDLVVVQTSSASWPEDRPLVDWLVARRGRVVLNGDYPLTHVDEVLDAAGPAVDGVVLDMLAGGLPALAAGDAAPPGVLLRGDERPLAQVRKNRPARLRPRHGLFPLRRYDVPWGLRRPATTVYASLGCTMRCRFCLAGTRPYRPRPVEDVLAELRYARRAGVREVVFFDPIFNGHRDRALALCERMRRERLRLSWSCFTRVDALDEELLRAWKAAGCHTLLIGIESGSDAVLARMDKRQTTATVRAAVAEVRAHGLRVGGFFMLGYEGESDAEIRETIRFATELDLAFASFQFVVPFTATELGRGIRRARGEDVPFVGCDDAERPFAVTPDRSPERLLALADEAYRAFYLRPGFIAKRALGIRSMDEARTLVREGLGLVLRR